MEENSWMALCTVFFLMLILGAIFLALIYDADLQNKALFNKLDGHDVCTIIDEYGESTKRIFVDPNESCPKVYEWHTVERTANNDIKNNSGSWPYFYGAMFLVGAAGCFTMSRIKTKRGE